MAFISPAHRGPAPTCTASAVGRRGDAVLMATLVLSAFAAAAIASRYGDLPLALAVSAAALACGGAMFGMARGRLSTRLVLTVANAGLVALQIDLGRGGSEYHFGVFVLMSVLPVYRDVRPLLLGAVFFAVHHVVFDRLQAAGFAVWCTPQPDIFRIAVHAGYVVVQTAAEVAIVVGMTRMSRAGEELTALLAAMRADGRMSLDVGALAFRSEEARALQASLVDIHALIGRLRASTQGVAEASRDIAAGNRDLSARTERSGACLQETTSSMARLSQGIGEAATVSRSSTQLIATTSEAAARSGHLMSDAVAAMAQIQSSARRIGDIIATVDGIAFQTNILALNAAVEAARAGEQGRGFAVVAGEVRTLALRSAQAAREVKTLVNASLDSVSHGTRLVDEAGTTTADVVDNVQRAAQLSERLTMLTNTQAASTAEVARAVADLDEMVQRNATLVEQTAAASTALGHETGELHATLANFAA